jgi:hypothetical protein
MVAGAIPAQRKRALVDRPAANMVPVFGQVGQMAEVGERADDANGLISRQTFEQFFKRLIGFMVGIAAKGHGKLAHLFDQFVGGHANVVANHIAENPAQQPNVLHQRTLVVSGSAGQRVSGALRNVFPDCFCTRGIDHLYPLFLKLAC